MLYIIEQVGVSPMAWHYNSRALTLPVQLSPRRQSKGSRLLCMLCSYEETALWLYSNFE